MKITIIISYYKALDNLIVILNSLSSQSDKNFEVIISEDDFNTETINFVNNHNYNFHINHIFQDEDNGFRKNIMLNKAILKSNTDYLVFIDGDCVPHRHFVKEYRKNFEKNYFFIGRAVMLDAEKSEQIKKEKSIDKINLFSVLFSKSERKKEGIYFPYLKLALKMRGLVGRNWGTHKQHLIDINGFDNDYILAGVGEDTDIEWRLYANGIKSKSIKNKAIVYHLYHERGYAEKDVKKNYNLFCLKKEKNQIKCINGLNQISLSK